MVLVQNWPFLNPFLGNIGQENVFYDIPEQKHAFLGYKNKKFKKVQKLTFSKEKLVHGFGSKFENFPTFLLGNRGQKNVFYDIVE